MDACPCAMLRLLAAAFLLLTGCAESENPLSDPLKTKPDARLAGVWRVQGDQYSVGPVGDGLPESVMRMVGVPHSKDGKLTPPGELLFFPTALGSNTYLNVTDGADWKVESLKKKDWRSIDSYVLAKYKVEGDTLLVWPMAAGAVKSAIETGKIKGVARRIPVKNPGAKAKSREQVMLTDTTENLARFVASEGDRLFSKEVLRLERVK